MEIGGKGKAIHEYLDPKYFVWTQPSGGYTIPLLLKDLKANEDEIVAHLFKRGVAF